MVAISLHSIVPVRTEPCEGAEQTTQMLFGEQCSIIEQKPRWNRVKLNTDGQEGWVDSKMITPMSDEEYRSYQEDLSSAAYVAFPMAYAVSENNGQTIPLTAGTRLTNYKDGEFELLGVKFRIDPSMVITKPLELNEDNLMQTVRFFLNIPYLWGGKNALGMDCSGFTQTILSLFGKHMLRNASEQATQGVEIDSLTQAQPGDLAFFDHHDGKITHVGMVLSSLNPQPSTLNCTIVHCSGHVKVERLDETGIFSIERTDKDHPNGQYTHYLASIRRM